MTQIETGSTSGIKSETGTGAIGDEEVYFITLRTKPGTKAIRSLRDHRVDRSRVSDRLDVEMAIRLLPGQRSRFAMRPRQSGSEAVKGYSYQCDDRRFNLFSAKRSMWWSRDPLRVHSDRLYAALRRSRPRVHLECSGEMFSRRARAHHFPSARYYVTDVHFPTVEQQELRSYVENHIELLATDNGRNHLI
ncbi:hypothetical protein EVAR_29626_1 [Eumeta japonica]|uniref:Uncharacterized protein n=1 Tax=Eumeta variegata TaxID=151549 RepID=A0A4C1WA64_EUMVA|nr:hypothetical protein EVAR_29626_1 [Eumeta japonica]